MIVLMSPVLFQSEPYLMLVNGTYEGYAIDLLNLLAESLLFKYEIKEMPDGYGMPDNRTKYGWTGVVGEILSGVSSLLWF